MLILSLYACIVVLLWARGVITEILINDEVPAGHLIVDFSTQPIFVQQLTKPNSFFRLISTGPFMNYLKIETDTGKLYARKKIDRDSLCTEIEMCCTQEIDCVIPLSVALLTKSKQTMEPFTQQLQLHIRDTNDHKPVFVPSNLNLSIAESWPLSTPFLLPSAVDPDSRHYSVKNYRLVSQDHGDVFSLETQLVDNKLAANLRLRQKLDREQDSRYSLTVVASDGGDPSLSGTLEINIFVTDVNDNPPVFENVRHTVNVKESVLLSNPITEMVATDKDIGENAEIFYKLDSSMSSMGSSDYFRVDLRSGALYLISALDYERQQSYKLVILATNRDHGMPTATATLTVNVINTNDEKPVIILDYLSSRQNAFISENVVAPLFVAIISVTDKDIGISGKIVCHLNNHQDVFHLRQSSQDQFKVYTRQQFDRETLAKYSLIVVCQDQGTPPLSSEGTVSVVILDDNDNSPEIKSSGTIRIRENKPIGTEVTRISATDKDEGLNSQLEFSISDSTNIISSFINIDPRSGVIKTAHLIDKESKYPPLSTINFVVTVTDGGSPKLSASMQMQLVIEDENDNEPKFLQHLFRFSVTENEPPQYRLGQIDINDADEVSSLSLSLKYSRKSYRKCPFSLVKEKSTYWLVTTKPLDWEEEPVHELVVVATDGPGYKSHTSTASVLVTVLDTNDHKPLFIFPRPGNNSWQSVSYRNKPGFVVITVTASDKDDSSTGNGKYHFTIISDHANLFSIDPNSGRIRIQRQMSVSDIGEHLLIIKVEDHGSPSLFSEMKIKIRITDSSTFSIDKFPDSENHVSYTDGPFTDKEAVLVFGLVFILLIVSIAVCFILYVRHMKGWLHFLPDIIGLCHVREHSPKHERYRKDENFITHNTDPNNLQNLNYPTQKFMVPFPPSYCQTPEPLIKNSRDCYEILKITSNTSPRKLIPGHSYNDLLDTTMIIPQYQDNYRTLHRQYTTEFPVSNYNIQNKSTKPLSRSNWNVSCQSVEKPLQAISVNSQNSYAVTFPSEESTFV